MKAIFYSGASGLMAQQQYMNNVGNNIANVNTSGYKPNMVSFEALLSSEKYVNTETDPLSSIGVKAVETGLNMNQGMLKSTNILSDFAIVGDGFFAVQDAVTGETQYTRDGTFAVSVEGSTGYLTAQDGSYVLDASGNKISLPKFVTDAGVESTTFDLSGIKDVIGVYSFDYAAALTPFGHNRYVESTLSGTATSMTSESVSVLQGSLECSGVSLEDEMAGLITGQRAYQISARVLQVGDENEQTINSLRR